MKALIASFAAGTLFALGLGIGGMLQASRVVAFLDVFGQWDPSLAFVMVGAITTHGLLLPLILRRPSPLFASSFTLPTRRNIDQPLVVGSAIFGAGWGLAGVCPGPGVALLASFSYEPLLFVVAMVVGIWVHGRFVAGPKGGAELDSKQPSEYDNGGVAASD